MLIITLRRANKLDAMSNGVYVLCNFVRKIITVPIKLSKMKRVKYPNVLHRGVIRTCLRFWTLLAHMSSHNSNGNESFAKQKKLLISKTE